MSSRQQEPVRLIIESEYGLKPNNILIFSSTRLSKVPVDMSKEDYDALDAAGANALDNDEEKDPDADEARAIEAADVLALGLPWKSKIGIERGLRTFSQRKAWKRILNKVRHHAISDCTLIPVIIRLLPLQYSTYWDPIKTLWGRLFEEEQSWRIFVEAPPG